MTKRVKSVGFETRSEFEDALNDVAAMTTEQRMREVDRDAELQGVMEAYNDDILDIKKKIKGLMAQAEKYALAHRSEVLPLGKKGGETALALFGFRTGMPTLALLNRKWNWQTVVDAMKAAGLERFIATKETPDKDGLKAHLDDLELANIGCRVKQQEAFWAEPKLDDGGKLG